MVKPRKPIHHFDRKELWIAVFVLAASFAIFNYWEPSAQVTAKNLVCSGDAPDGYCDYGWRSRCEAGCSDCSTCLSFCTDICAQQGQSVKFCRDEWRCVCQDENPCTG